MPRIEGPDEDAAETQHTADFGEGGLGRVHMMKYAEGVDDVERVRVELQVLGVHHAQVSLEALQFEPPSRQVNAARRQIYPRHHGTRPAELQVVRSQPDPDLKHTRSPVALEAEGRMHPWLLAVAVLLDLAERVGAAQRLRAHRQRPSRIAAPLLARRPLNGFGALAVLD